MAEAKRALRAVDSAAADHPPPQTEPAKEKHKRRSPYVARRRWRYAALASLALTFAVGVFEGVRYLGDYLSDAKLTAVVGQKMVRNIMVQNKCFDRAGKLVGAGPGCDAPAILEGVNAVLKVAYRRGLDISWAQAIIRVETNWDKYAVSERLALGLTQTHDAAWTQELKRRGIIRSSWDLFDPVKSVEAMAEIWGEYLHESRGDKLKTACKYNAGYTGNCGEYPQQVAAWARSL